MGCRGAWIVVIIGAVACGGDYIADGPGARGKADDRAKQGNERATMKDLAGASGDDFYGAFSLPVRVEGDQIVYPGRIYRHRDGQWDRIAELEIETRSLWVGEIDGKQAVIVTGGQGRRAWIDDDLVALSPEPLGERVHTFWNARNRLWGADHSTLYLYDGLDERTALDCPGRRITMVAAVGQEVYAVASDDGKVFRLDASTTECEALQSAGRRALYGVGGDEETLVVAGHGGLWRRADDGHWLRLYDESLIGLATVGEAVVVQGIGTGLAVFDLGDLKKANKTIEPHHPTVKIDDPERPGDKLKVSGKDLTVFWLRTTGDGAALALASITGTQQTTALLRSDDGRSWEQLPLPLPLD